MLLDTGIVYAYYDRSDRWHRAAVELVGAELGGLMLPGPVVPEVDHLLGVRLGAHGAPLSPHHFEPLARAFGLELVPAPPAPASPTSGRARSRRG